MSEELKACPHCGVHYFIHEIDDYYYCSECRIKVPKDKYNIRPIEDALAKKLEVAVKALNKITVCKDGKVWRDKKTGWIFAHVSIACDALAEIEKDE